MSIVQFVAYSVGRTICTVVLLSCALDEVEFGVI